ncbi:MAG: PHP domain-containing protein [Monoglobales bacterium]
MFEEYKYKTELHSHTGPVSRCSEITPELLIKCYEGNGYDSVAITNHYYSALFLDRNTEDAIDFFLNDYYMAKELGEKSGINVIFGVEFGFSENRNDYLVYGITPDELREMGNVTELGIDGFYKQYKNDKNIIIQAHPFRDNMQRANLKSIDGVEVFNLHPNHNSRVALAAKYSLENNLLGICGSDFHHPGQDCLCAILTKEKITNSFELAKILKSKDFIMEIGGYKILPHTI